MILKLKKFISQCKKLENQKGYLSQNIFDLKINSNYKFSSGPFCEMIFKIIDLQKDRIDILMGNIKTTIKKQEFLFNQSKINNEHSSCKKMYFLQNAEL